MQNGTVFSRCRRGFLDNTPACAGKTKCSDSKPPRSQDHPRMRGEDCPSSSVASVDFGSPPHARGRLFRRFPDFVDERITPACAGKTSHASSAGTTSRDHPRMRGEDFVADTGQDFQQGSPPHARGTQIAGDVVGADPGITPACAGKTHVIFSKMLQCFKSPPHARGRRQASRESCRTAEITPACAGKTLLSFSASNASASSARARLACSSWPLTSNVSASGCRR